VGKTHRQIVADHDAASVQRDIAGMMAGVSPGVAWTEMVGFPCAGTWTDPAQAIAHMLVMLGREWEGDRFTLEQLISGDEQVVDMGTYSGTACGSPCQRSRPSGASASDRRAAQLGCGLRPCSEIE